MNPRLLLVCVLVGSWWSSLPAHAQEDAGVLDAGVPCGDVDTLGQCQGNVLRLCVGGLLTTTSCPQVYGPGFACVLTPPVMAAQCVFVPDDGGNQAPEADAGPLSINPTKEPDASPGGCIKPAWGQSAAWMVGLVVLRPARRRRG